MGTIGSLLMQPLLLNFFLLLTTAQLVWASSQVNAFIGNWNNQSVVQEKNGFYHIRNASHLEQLKIDGSTNILALASSSNPIALVQLKGRLRLLELKSTGECSTIDLPQEITGKIYELFASKNEIVLLEDKKLHCLHSGEWREIELNIPAKIEQRSRLAHTVKWAFDSPYLYLGLDGGEFAGGLYVFNIESKKWDDIDQASKFRITELLTNSRGETWFTADNFRLATKSGVVGKINASQISIIHTSNANSNNDNKAYTPSFCSISWGESGTAYYMGKEFGIAKWESGKWISLSKNWNSTRKLDPYKFMILPGEKKAVVLTKTSGAVFVDLES